VSGRIHLVSVCDITNWPSLEAKNYRVVVLPARSHYQEVLSKDNAGVKGPDPVRTLRVHYPNKCDAVCHNTKSLRKGGALVKTTGWSGGSLNSRL